MVVVGGGGVVVHKTFLTHSFHSLSSYICLYYKIDYMGDIKEED